MTNTRKVTRSWAVAAVVAVAALCSSVGAQPGDASQMLQGRWVVTSGEHEGKPLDAIVGGVMSITGDAFEIRTRAGNMLRGTLRLNTATMPFQMDMVHADGLRWEAIFEVAGDRFRLNYVPAGGKDPRPATFTTSERTDASMVTLQRENR